MVAGIGTGEAFERGRDFRAWLGLVPRNSTGGESAAKWVRCPTTEHAQRSETSSCERTASTHALQGRI
jgi:hypothetical protein